MYHIIEKQDFIHTGCHELKHWQVIVHILRLIFTLCAIYKSVVVDLMRSIHTLAALLSLSVYIQCVIHLTLMLPLTTSINCLHQRIWVKRYTNMSTQQKQLSRSFLCQVIWSSYEGQYCSGEDPALSFRISCWVTTYYLNQYGRHMGMAEAIAWQWWSGTCINHLSLDHILLNKSKWRIKLFFGTWSSQWQPIFY